MKEFIGGFVKYALNWLKMIFYIIYDVSICIIAIPLYVVFDILFACMGKTHKDFVNWIDDVKGF